MATDLAAPGPFAPYVKAVAEDPTLMKYVPMNHMDIGANAVSLCTVCRLYPEDAIKIIEKYAT